MSPGLACRSSASHVLMRISSSFISEGKWAKGQRGKGAKELPIATTIEYGVVRLPRRNSLTKYVRTPTAPGAACPAARATSGSRKTLLVRSSSRGGVSVPALNSRSSKSASASSQYFRSVSLAMSSVKFPLGLSPTKSILARSGRPTFFWRFASGTKTLKGEI